MWLETLVVDLNRLRGVLMSSRGDWEKWDDAGELQCVSFPQTQMPVMGQMTTTQFLTAGLT